MAIHQYSAVGDEEGDAELSSHLSNGSFETLKAITSSKRSWRTVILNNVIVALVSFISLLLGLVIGYAFGERHATQQFNNLPRQSLLVPSPAYEGISQNLLVTSPKHGMDHMYDNPFMGFPTPEKDKIWQETMHGYSLRIPTTAFEDLNRTSIPLNDDSGDSWAVLSVSHHLHCLDSIRHQIAQVGCKPTSKKMPKDYFPAHIDHCIEMIRQRVMCQPDVGIRGVVWNEDQMWASASNDIDRECVDWSVLEEWTKKNMFFADEKLITRPGGSIYPGPYTPPARCEST